MSGRRWRRRCAGGERRYANSKALGESRQFSNAPRPTLRIDRLVDQVADMVREGAGAQIAHVRAPAVLGEDRASQVVFFLLHQFQDALVLVLVQPEAVAVLAIIHVEIEQAVLEAPHRLAALGAGEAGALRAQHQTALLVVAEIEHFVLKLLQFLPVQPHALAGWTELDIDAAAFRRHKRCIAFWTFHRADVPLVSVTALRNTIAPIRPVRDAAAPGRPARWPSLLRPPARRGCRHRDRGGPW